MRIAWGGGTGSAQSVQVLSDGMLWMIWINGRAIVTLPGSVTRKGRTCSRGGLKSPGWILTWVCQLHMMKTRVFR